MNRRRNGDRTGHSTYCRTTYTLYISVLATDRIATLPVTSIELDLPIAFQCLHVLSCTPTMEALFFNSHSGYLEGIIRGFKAGLISQTQYSNLTQCETLDGQSRMSQRPRSCALCSLVYSLILQTSACNCLQQITATFWPTRHLRSRPVQSPRKQRRSSSTSSTTSEVTQFNHSPSSWIT